MDYNSIGYSTFLFTKKIWRARILGIPPVVEYSLVAKLDTLNDILLQWLEKNDWKTAAVRLDVVDWHLVFPDNIY